MWSGFPSGAVVKNLHANAEDTWDAGLIPGLGRSPGVGNDNLFQYSCLENSIGRRAWRTIVHGVAESDTTEHWERKGARAGYPGVPNIITSILISGRETLESQCQRDVVWERRDWMLLALKVERSCKAKKCRQSLEEGKGKARKWIFSLSL